MTNPIRILHLEDNVSDVELIRATLESQNIDCEILHVKGQKDFENAVNHSSFDLILSDYSVPSYNGFAALNFARKKNTTTPFILVSGTLGEEEAIESLKSGATDYIVKQRLVRLGPAIRRALDDAKALTERERTEENLRKSEERFQFVARATNDVFWDWDLRTNSVWWSEAFQKAFGDRTENIEPGIESRYNRLHPEDEKRVVSGIEAAIRAGDQYWSSEYRFRRSDGQYVHILDRGYVIHDPSKKPVRMIGAMLDITERKRAEERIREQAALLDKAQDAICLNDMSQKILYWNKSAERLYGWTAEEAVGKNSHDLLFQGELAGQMDAIRNLIRRGEWKGELHQVAKGGKKLEIESRWTLMRDERGQPKSILVINTDVTEKKQTEAQLFRTQRMESVGALAGGIAHDLNNALAPILMAAEMLRSELTSEDGRQMLDVMKKSAERGADMVRQILSFSRGVGGEHKILQFKHLISEIEKFARSTFPRSIEVQTHLGESLFPISGDATQLHQVLLNLCINARDAMPNGGILRIEARNAKPDETYSGSTVQGRHIVLEVSDTGQGIAPELLAKIFEPFFTTKEIGKGTGLGLSTVVGIVKTHGGFIDVSSVVGKGTTFRVFLPAAVGERQAAEQKRPVLPSGSGELVLLVDDEVAILEMTKLILESYNYRILSAKDPLEAIDLFKKHSADIKVVITDMMMPVMNGPELVKHLREMNPDLKVIGTSGLGSGAELAQAARLIVQTFLTKPYRPETLLLQLNQMLTAK